MRRKKDNILISIIIPTYFASPKIATIALDSVRKQTVSKNKYEIIIAHNGKESDTAEMREIGKRYNAKLIKVNGKPPQVCKQINAGARIAKGKYILILDHDVELSPRLIENFFKLEKKFPNIDSWYMPYKVVARGFLNKVRNFEEKFYQHSIIAVPRITKKSIFFKTDNQYEPLLSGGPADWDFTNQLREISAKFKYINEYAYHHEEGLSYWEFISKKRIYAKGGEIYKKKWAKRNKKIYNEIVKKQYSPVYRLIGIFIENGKWKLFNLQNYFLFLIMKGLMAGVYFYNVKKR